jgi:hypothetical protein
MPHDKLSDFASEFLICKLVPTLTRLGCGDSMQSKAISWFHTNAKFWSATSGPEFDSIAETRLTEFVTTLAIKQGTQKSLSAGRRHLQRDAVQAAWVNLLESGRTDGRSANIAGRNAGHDITETESQYVSVTPDDDVDIPTPAPWETVDDGEYYRENWSYDVERWLKHCRTADREQIVRQFIDESPEDWQFLVNYLARSHRRGQGRWSKKDQNRAQKIYAKLRRRDTLK